MHTGSLRSTQRPWGSLEIGDRAAWAMRAMIAAVALRWWMEGNPVWASIGAVCVGLSLLPAIVLRRSELRMQTTLTVSVLLLAHVCLGMESGLYELSSVYDKLAHAFGSGLIAANIHAAMGGVCRRHQIALPPAMQAIIALATVISIGVAWEVFEFTVDLTGLVSAQKGLTDTMIDLIANSVGAFAALVAIGAWRGWLAAPVIDAVPHH